MAALFTFGASAPAPALLLLLLLAAGARAYWATTAECKPSRVVRSRFRQYPTDSNATKLYMENCGLTEINLDMFTGLPILEGIYLSNNNIKNMNWAALHSVPTLKWLSLSDNKLRELPVSDEHWCPNLTILDLDRNLLTGINDAGTFSACTKLEYLYLNDNQIDFIHPDVFRLLAKLRVLSLYKNKIRFIPGRLLADNSKLEVLDLHGNRITHLPPDFASSLKRAGTGLVEFYFYHNPWHCACLLEVLADVWRAGVRKYAASRYDGSQPVCAYSGPEPCCRAAPSGLLRPARGGC